MIKWKLRRRSGFSTPALTKNVTATIFAQKTTGNNFLPCSDDRKRFKEEVVFPAVIYNRYGNDSWGGTTGNKWFPCSEHDRLQRRSSHLSPYYQKWSCSEAPRSGSAEHQVNSHVQIKQTRAPVGTAGALLISFFAQSRFFFPGGPAFPSADRPFFRMCGASGGIPDGPACFIEFLAQCDGTDRSEKNLPMWCWGRRKASAAWKPWRCDFVRW